MSAADDLGDGHWVQRRGVRVWLASAPVTPATTLDDDATTAQRRRALEADVARAKLLAAVTAERNDTRWWPTPPRNWNATAIAGQNGDDDVTTARRRKVLVESWMPDVSEESA
jgi:hypothetical protein